MYMPLSPFCSFDSNFSKYMSYISKVVFQKYLQVACPLAENLLNPPPLPTPTAKGNSPTK